MIAILAMVALGNASYAQESPEQRVKILPTSAPGIIKLHYAIPVDEPVLVTFFSKDRDVLRKDRIQGITAPEGISKKYDINKIGSDFLMEISTSKHVLIYRVTASTDRKTFTAELEPTSYQFLVSRANN